MTRPNKPARRSFPIALTALATSVFALVLGATVALAAPEAPVISKVAVSQVSESSATLKGTIDPGEKKTKYRFEYVDQASFEAEGFNAALRAPIPDGVIPEGITEGVPIEAPIEGLTAATVYHYRLFASNSKGELTSPERTFATFVQAPSFGSCPNDQFRNEHPSSALPDCRAYEQASPIDKNGGDASGISALIKASSTGAAISFSTTSPISGGDGAQGPPNYLAVRDAGGWSTHGLMPPATAGARALVLGWQPDFSQVFSRAERFDATPTSGFFSRPGSGGPLTQIAPYTLMSGDGNYNFAGASEDGSKVLFEVPADLGTTPAGIEGKSNVYAWDRESETLHLASVMNEGQPPAKGAFAGPYDWAARRLNEGGANSYYYLQDQHAVNSAGSVFFTAGGTGQLYLRRNPTQPQSAMSGEECTEAGKACTFHVSASHRTVPDSGGAQSAAFMAASADGSKAFFTSSEMLTNDANTGPEQPLAGIGRADIGGSPIDASFLSAHHALGMAVAGGFLYWADPSKGSIGRAKLNGAGIATEVDDEFIVPGPTEVETHPKTKPGVFESGPSHPRYVAVDSEYVYWTNSGPPGESSSGTEFQQLDKGGTIGRAKLLPGGGVDEIKPEFIKGASNPQGIGVNASHIYWANAANDPATRSIGRAEIDGGKVEQKFFQPSGTTPYGLALSASHVYFGLDEGGNDNGYMGRIPLEGGVEEILGVGKRGMRGVAVDSSHVYWATQTEGAIGRVPLSDFKTGGCAGVPTCEKEFVKAGGAPLGLAADAEHLYWSTNGESQPNPGNDLYRYDAESGALSDLTPDPTKNGAEVQGVLGTSEDGSYVYFAANGDLDGPETGSATPGDCHGRTVADTNGSCNLYLWHEGALSFLGRLKTGGSFSDAFNWTGAARVSNGSTSAYLPKTSFVSADGRTLLFRSQAKLTAYDNEGTSELYRYRDGDPEQIHCVSCNPTGEAATDGPTLGTILPPGAQPLEPAALASHILSADGERAFFETTEALVSADTNGEEGCPSVGSASQGFPICLDVYEWEAPGKGSCEEGGPGFAPTVGGCLYLISTGKGEEPALFGDASASGDDVFFFTRLGLVGHDEDELLDVYDARVDGGLASQNEAQKSKCEGEACKPASTPPPTFQPPPNFSGPPNPTPRRPRACPKGKHRVKSRCIVKRHKGHRKRHAGHNRGGSK